MTVGLRALGVHGVVLDIEGTTTPVTFVYDVLFPFARAHLRSYLRAHIDSDVMRVAARRLHDEYEVDVASGTAPPPWNESTPEGELWSLAAYAEWLMERDRKSPGLKLLQGQIWEQGYREGALRGVVFSDVPGALTRWREAGMDVAIYSSGSVLAQRLLFGSTEYGDLTRFMSGFFDTDVGAKGEAESYRRIAASLRCAPKELLFVSDVMTELEAARAAELQVALCVRPGNAPQSPDNPVDTIRSFDEIVV